MQPVLIGYYDFLKNVDTVGTTFIHSDNNARFTGFMNMQPRTVGKNLPNMNKFCDWLSETKVISVHDSFF